MNGRPSLLQVHLLVRGKNMRASKAMQDRVLQHPNVSVHLNTLVEDAYADPKGNMGGLLLQHAETGARLTYCTLLVGLALQPWAQPLQSLKSGLATIRGDQEATSSGVILWHRAPAQLRHCCRPDQS